jgi:mercuric ion transport protein
VSRTVHATVGAVVAAFLASLCCVGPLLFVAFGVGAGLASTFEPLRPALTVLTVAFLAAGFYVVYGRRPAAVSMTTGAATAAATGAGCVPDGTPDGTCAIPRNRGRDQVLLWVATVVALVLLTFPQWSLYLV